ncbi:MAG: hypothetical protein ACI915_002497 [Gammaproteobacteria bacterium]|jgi:hypothetical protein
MVERGQILARGWRAKVTFCRVLYHAPGALRIV